MQQSVIDETKKATYDTVTAKDPSCLVLVDLRNLVFACADEVGHQLVSAGCEAVNGSSKEQELANRVWDVVVQRLNAFNIGCVWCSLSPCESSCGAS
jgi:hypothetical protein